MTRTELRRWIERRKLTQRELARQLGVHFTTVHRWLAGTSPMPRWLGAMLEQLDKRRRNE